MRIFDAAVLPGYDPFADEAANLHYNMLFSDNPALFRSSEQPVGYPWNILLNGSANERATGAVSSDAALGSRSRLLAHYLLISKGHKQQKKDLLGVVTEISGPEGPEVIAGYADGTAHYLSSGGILSMDKATSVSVLFSEELLTCGHNILRHLSPWESIRRPFPRPGMVRLSFLATDGLYYGEDSIDRLNRNELSGSVLSAAYRTREFIFSTAPFQKSTEHQNVQI